MITQIIIPPLVGASIGYITNLIAIKMLFKPYRPIYIKKHKLPFTPGVIPSKREKLAHAIAKVVKENLLTEETIIKRINEDKVKQDIKGFIVNILRNPLIQRTLEDYIHSSFYHTVNKYAGFIPSNLINMVSRKLTSILIGSHIYIHHRRNKLTEMISTKIVKIIEKELPLIMQSIDIEKIIEEKVNSLAINEIEDLILKLISEELNYITIFGGVIGFVIGICQSILFIITS